MVRHEDELTYATIVSQVICIGPVSQTFDADLIHSELPEIEIMDSIEMDPMLSWFWRRSRPLVAVHA